MLKTRDFGEIELDESQVIEMTAPILGFEQYRTFVILRDEEVGEHLLWLQSTQEPSLCFVLFDKRVFEEYQPVIPAEVERLVGAGECGVYVMATIPQDITKATVNLKSPIILNLHTRRAAQFVLEQDYPVRFSLQPEG